MKEINITYESLSEVEKAYWAGLLDGEGCLMFQKNSKTGYRFPTVTLAMTCLETVTKFKEIFDAGSVKTRSRSAMKDHWKDCYCVALTTHKAAKLCEALLPYFITKKEIAKEISKHYYRKCEVCGKDFWANQQRSTCSDTCFKERCRRKAYLYR